MLPIQKSFCLSGEFNACLALRIKKGWCTYLQAWLKADFFSYGIDEIF